MKKIIVVLLLFMGAGAAFVNSLSAKYGVVDIYVCERSAHSAELLAKVLANRIEIQRASYCKCDRLNGENKDKVKKGKWEKEGYVFEYGKCEPPEDKVFHCFCVGFEEA